MKFAPPGKRERTANLFDRCVAGVPEGPHHLLLELAAHRFAVVHDREHTSARTRAGFGRVGRTVSVRKSC